jgi:predicted transcriptional regulator
VTSEQAAQFVREYVAGTNMQVIATRCGIRRQTVANHLRRASVALRRQGIPSDQLADAARLYAAGWSAVALQHRPTE